MANKLGDKRPCKEYVAVLALNDDKIVVLRQFRPFIHGDSFELPGGAVELDEAPEVAVRRELLEETGLKCHKLQYLGETDVCPYLTADRCHLFFCRETTKQGSQSLNRDEVIKVAFVSIDEVLLHLQSGLWCNSELAHALLLAKLKGYLTF